MDKVLLKRSRILKRSLEKVADRIESGKLTPGREEAIDSGGEPVCAFGWALVGAFKEARLKPVPIVGNDEGLEEFLNGSYETAIPEDVKGDLREAVEEVGRVNDSIFFTDDGEVRVTKTDRKKVARACRKAAMALEKKIITADLEKLAARAAKEREG